jgi:hypothetical protein
MSTAIRGKFGVLGDLTHGRCRVCGGGRRRLVEQFAAEAGAADGELVGESVQARYRASGNVRSTATSPCMNLWILLSEGRNQENPARIYIGDACTSLENISDACA